MLRRLGILVMLAGCWACVNRQKLAAVAQSEIVIAPIITTERGPSGGRLVALAEDGTRQENVTPIEVKLTIDSHPEVSPDGEWIVFSSNRNNEEMAHTNLWLISLATRELFRLTNNQFVDRDPVFAADGKSVIFARSGGDGFDLWRVALLRNEKGLLTPGKESALLKTAAEELSPSVSPDGNYVAYAALDRTKQISQIWQLRLVDGKTSPLSAGPADVTPRYSPDGKTLAFAGLAPGRDDMDLFVMSARGQGRKVFFSEKTSDETGPVWSRDGRYLFATAVFRSVQDRKPILASLVFIDMSESPRVLRGLYDASAVTGRIGVAIMPQPLESKALHKHLPYALALQKIVEEAYRLGHEKSSPKP